MAPARAVADVIGLAALLNADFMANPLTSEAAPGVLMHSGTRFKMDCGATCKSRNESEIPDDPRQWPSWSDCRVSTTLLNYAWSVAKNNSCEWYPADEIITYVVPPIGWVYNFSRTMTAVRCSYAADAGTRFRYNYGCGCYDFDTKLCKDGNCSNACMNIDSWTEETNTADSRQVSSCQCSSTDESMVENQCYWKGPAFYDGEGENQMHKMIRQRLKHPEEVRCHLDEFGFHGDGLYNEVILSTQALEELLAQDFAATIPAFIVVAEPGKYTQEEAQRMKANLTGYDMYSKQLDSLPVLGLNRKQVSAPFYVLPSSAPLLP